MSSKRLLRLPEVEKITGYKKASIYRLMKLNQFPKSISLGERAKAWVSTDIDSWVNERIGKGVESA